MSTTRAPEGDAHEHFTARAERYDRSSHWCTDPVLARAILEHTQPQPGDEVLDVACGTGLVSRHFQAAGARVTGLDITEAMYAQAKPYLVNMIVASASEMPIADDTFDVAVCRQGTQFMEDAKAISEMVRVVKPGGKIAVINLCAYGPEDRDEYYEILRLRNPARCNFYLREDLRALLMAAGCSSAVVHDHVSLEDVDVWSDNGAIEESRREGIRAVYRSASDAFRQLHAVASEDGNRFMDNMLFGIAVGVK